MKILEEYTQKRVHTKEETEKAREMYFRGLYLDEISKLLEIPQTTLKKWVTKYGWANLKAAPPAKEVVYKLKKAGKTNAEISEMCKISIPTICRWCKETKEKAKNEEK